LNSANKKLSALEKSVLPEKPSPFSLCLENEAEIELSRKANRIRKSLDFDILGVWHNNKLTFEEKKKATFEAYDRFSAKEKQILTKESEFYRRRLEDLLIEYFESTFPCKNREPLLRVTWFFNEMGKLSISQYLEDSEWYHNRDEDEPDFDDFKWWSEFESKVKEEFPDGVFTEKSFEKTKELYDNLMGKCMCEYWEAHPEEYNKLIEKLENSKTDIKKCI